MTPDQTNTRRRTTTLHRASLALQRYKAWANRLAPRGAPLAQWLAWREWYASRIAAITALRDSELEKLRKHKEKKANERKRDRGTSRRGC